LLGRLLRDLVEVFLRHRPLLASRHRQHANADIDDARLDPGEKRAHTAAWLPRALGVGDDDVDPLFLCLGLGKELARRKRELAADQKGGTNRPCVHHALPRMRVRGARLPWLRRCARSTACRDRDQQPASQHRSRSDYTSIETTSERRYVQPNATSGREAMTRRPLASSG
jgi:hypothetical protein